ncbi:MAG: DUF6938 domain-containing protein [Patescibacteria group bacterium]|jgi:hypothetical protein
MKINLVTTDMGYGHQRAAYPLLDLSQGKIFNTNDYQGMTDWEKKYWHNNLKSYETISRFKKVPLVGNLVFRIMDEMQKIDPFYPNRDLSKLTLQQKFFQQAIRKGLGKNLIESLAGNNLPLVTTFFVAAYMADHFNYPQNIYSIICDADASRAWGPLKLKDSRIKFLLPSEKVKKRFLMYGVKEENIFVTGFPLPKENIGEKQEILIKDLAQRLVNLDPQGEYQRKYQALIKDVLPPLEKKTRPLTITFAVGGAGAQKELGASILANLSGKIKKGEIKLNLVAGVRTEVKEYFREHLALNNISAGSGVEIIFASQKNDYFKIFNQVLRETDILWTKPSELSFYAGLGLPIIMSEPVGSQEDFNREWLISIGAGIDSFDPRYTDEWLTDMLNSGNLARAAMNGFLNAESMGTYNIERLINSSN